MRIPELISATFDCPGCGESNELLIDPTGGEKQEFVEDCAICCRPAAITVRVEGGLLVSIEVEPES